MNNLVETFAASLQIAALREDAIKACRAAQTRAYAAQKAANVPQDQRCKAPVIGKGKTLAEIRGMTAAYEQIVAHPRMTNSRRDILARRVEMLTGLKPGPEVSIEEMLETIEDCLAPPTAVRKDASKLPRIIGGERCSLSPEERQGLESRFHGLKEQAFRQRVNHATLSLRVYETSDRALESAIVELGTAIEKERNRPKPYGYWRRAG